uniref:Uncharacterized protein n=1 Tax=Setaria italica TaxID=4555 RepID=K3ZBH6_SETIT
MLPPPPRLRKQDRPKDAILLIFNICGSKLEHIFKKEKKKQRYTAKKSVMYILEMLQVISHTPFYNKAPVLI